MTDIDIMGYQWISWVIDYHGISCEFQELTCISDMRSVWTRKRRTDIFGVSLAKVSKESSPPAAVSSSPLQARYTNLVGAWGTQLKDIIYYITINTIYIYVYTVVKLIGVETNNIWNHHLWKIIVDSQRIFADAWLMLLWLVPCFLLLAY